MVKLNILIGNPNGCLPDFVNIDPFASTGDKTLLCDPSKLSEYFDNGELECIRAANVISFFRAGDVMQLLDHWVSKLSYDGELIITDLDIVQTMKAYDRGELNFVELNAVIYGPQAKNWDTRKCALSLSEVAAALIDLNIDIVEKRLDGIIFHIKGVRKCPTK